MSKLQVLPPEGAPAAERVQCPSARPEMPGSRAFGIVLGSDQEPRVAYLERTVAVTPALLASTAPVAATEVFRFAAPCAGRACQHFDGASCRLAERIVRRLPAVVDALPLCAIRPACRWFRQEGESACLRCPLVASESCGTASISEELRAVASPDAPIGPTAATELL